MKKKVLILVNHDIVIYNFRKELVERLLTENYEVIISSPFGERIDDLIEMGCKYVPITMERHGTNPYKELKLLRYYKKLMKKVSPDVVLTYTIKPNIYGGMAAKSQNIPYIANITGLGTAVQTKGIMQKASIFLYKIAFSKIQTVFFQNKENMQLFIDNNIAVEKHKLLPGSGVNLEQFKVLEYPDKNTIEFVFISRIMKEKGIDEYIEAAKYITSKYPYAKFHICGFCEEDYEEQLTELQNANILTYHGMIRDIRSVLKEVHCIIHPTYHEGMSNVLLESAASGRPILASDIPGCREIFEKNSGIGFEPKNINNLIHAIEEFLELDYEEKKEMGLVGRRKVEKEFDRQIVVEEYLKELNMIFGGNLEWVYMNK